jgi:hypothetical protein
MEPDVPEYFYAMPLWYSLMTRVFDDQANGLRLGELNTALDVLGRKEFNNVRKVVYISAWLRASRERATRFRLEVAALHESQ